MAKRIICAILCLLLLCCTACGKDSGTTSDTDSKANSSTASKKDDKPINNGPHPTTEAQWVAVPFTSQQQKDAGLAGGEGSQWPTYISFDHIDGSLAFLGIDVGGMYRSKDGGKNWEPCTIGINSSASSGAEIDPTNNKRVLCVGCDSSPQKHHGLYLSTDGGDSWKAVNPQNVQGHRDFRHQIAYDKSSYDKQKGYCTTVYYVRESKKIGEHYLKPALFKSTDGGETWSEVCNDKAIGNGIIYVNPKNGWVYISNEEGALRSKDGGKTFSKMFDKVNYGMCVVNTRPDNVYISAKDGFYLSTNGGDSFTKINEVGYPTARPSRINVSPANPNNMMLQDDHLSAGLGYSSVNYYSNDGGKSWYRSTTDSSLSFVPYNIRETVFAWHPTDPNICISTGGDMVMRSTDAGKTFKWSGSGYNGSCTTGIFFNTNNPDLVFCSNQDYNGAYSTNGGKTWTYTNFSGEGWGGYTYGGYCVSKDIVIGVPRIGDVHYIARSTDGCKTVTRTQHEVHGEKRGYGVIGKENIVFIGEWRSEDYGATWTKMENCSGVHTSTPDGKILYGKNGGFELVRSTDYGKTWEKIKMVEGLGELKYDEFNKRLLILGGGTIRTYNEKTNKIEIVCKIGYDCRSFDVDPRNGNLYASVRSDAQCKQVGVIRSTDGGKTWVNMSRAPGDGSVGPDGGKKPESIVINRKTFELWTNCGCRGVWKIACKA